MNSWMYSFLPRWVQVICLLIGMLTGNLIAISGIDNDNISVFAVGVFLIACGIYLIYETDWLGAVRFANPWAKAAGAAPVSIGGLILSLAMLGVFIVILVLGFLLSMLDDLQ